MVRVEFMRGEAITPLLPALSRLRIAVFRAWPYLYDGTPEDENEYLAHFAASAGAGLAVAFDGAQPVGCSTAMPMADADEAIRAPLADAGFPAPRTAYFGESVLLPSYRGQGVGVAFFAERERHARDVLGADFAAFCAVDRPAVHPLKPADAVPLDAFWTHRGFVRLPGVACEMSWKQVDGAEEVTNRLTFWAKPLGAAPLP